MTDLDEYFRPIIEEYKALPCFSIVEKVDLSITELSPVTYKILCTIHVFGEMLNFGGRSPVNHRINNLEVSLRLRLFFKLVKSHLETPFIRLPLYLNIKSDHQIPETIIRGRLKVGV